jgi:hypothetical protein
MKGLIQSQLLHQWEVIPNPVTNERTDSIEHCCAANLSFAQLAKGKKSRP